MNPLQRRVIPAMALCLAPLFCASATAADSTEALPGPPLRYRSAFADYQPFVDRKPGNSEPGAWRSRNDAVKGDGMADMFGAAGMAMPGMPQMPAAGKGSASGPVESNSPGHAMPMPEAHSDPTAGKAHGPAAMASMPGMPAMPGMAGHTGHDMPGNKP